MIHKKKLLFIHSTIKLFTLFFLFANNDYFLSLFSASSSSSQQQQHLVPPPPLAIIIPSSLQNHHHQLPQLQNQVHQIVELSEIPPPKELDLLSIPKPSSLRLEEIRMPPEGSKIKIPKSKVELTELVAANGDGYEEILVTKCNKDDFDPQLK